MKLISLNTWGGRAGKEILLGFFSRHQDADIFCLQEVWHGGEDMGGKLAGGRPLVGILHTLLSEVSARLPDHQSFFHPHFREHYGLAMFVKKTLPVQESGDVFVYKERGQAINGDPGNHPRNIQYAVVEALRDTYVVVNFHGLWQPGIGKVDTEDRLRQADNIATFLKSREEDVILCGDFNLLPETESMKKLERLGLKNLTPLSGAVSTRTSLYDKPEKRDMLIDHMLVSPGITVKDFKVLPDEVSDHAPLFLEFE